MHDDCVENDDLFNGTVTNSFFDGCYVAFSTRRSDGTTSDGHLNTLTISNSLVRLQAMPTVYKGSAAGHGGFFKWDDAAPGRARSSNITNSIFRADQDTNHQDLNLPAGYYISCSNNTMVWLGPGAFRARSLVLHGDDGSLGVGRGGPRLGHESPRGDHRSGGVGRRRVGRRRALRRPHVRFPLSLSSPPGTGKSVTVYWSTAPGTAGSNDFATKKGKAVFTGSQVHKTIVGDGEAGHQR